MKYSEDKNVAFDKESHVYYLGNKKLTSVTSLISKFKNEFDSDYWSKKIALREGKTQKEILKLWNDKAKKSCDIGTAIHKIFEDYIEWKYHFVNEKIYFDMPLIEDNYLIEFTEKKHFAIKFLEEFFIKQRLIPIYTEYIVYDDSIAGQVDCVCKNSKDEYFILDFKTNDKIETNSYNKNLKGILSELPDSSFYHYSLQLSIYKNLIQKQIKGMYIVHIKKDGYKLIECIDVLKELNVTLNQIINYATLPKL